MLSFPIASSIYSFTGNTIAESMYEQVHTACHLFVLMTEINDPKSVESAVPKDDGCEEEGPQSVRQSKLTARG